jgi:hypothetical protein
MKKHLVQVMHKQFDMEKDGQSGLAVGKVFRFRSGDAYQVQPSGAVINVIPKQYVSKADRKRWKQQRRERRAAEQSEIQTTK